MTRRLVVALLAFTSLVLLATVVPLGVTVSSRDSADYRASTRALAQSLATLAQDAFDDPHRQIPPARLAAAAGKGVAAAVVDLRGRVVSQTSEPALSREMIAAARAHYGRVISTDDAVVASSPVLADGVPRGTVVVARSDEPVEHRIARLWAVLLVVALGALGISVGLAVAAARWVGRPLRHVQATAHRWSEGSLHERADVSVGPPEVQEMARALNVMAARLDTLVHASRAVIADVAHQLRTPLSAMRLRLELMEDSSGEGGDRALALAEVDRLSRLVDGLLTVARAEAVDTVKTTIDITAVLRERHAAWQPVAEERGVDMSVRTPSGSAMASASAGHLEQVLDNLIDNALEALSDGGSIELSVDEQPDGIVVEVTDDGPGMTPEQQMGAFRRFTSHRTTHEGTGLGLAVVHRLVTADGGTVSLRCPASGGTVVRIVLPPARGGSAQADDAARDVGRG
jgi:signal transduction histidine kinase